MEEVAIKPIQKKFEPLFVRTFGHDYFDAEDEAQDHFRQYLGTDRLFLLFVGSKLVGFFNYFSQYSHYANYLEDICVASAFRGKGYSKLLLTRYIDISREQQSENKVALSSTHKKNVDSQKMHKNFGFRKIGVLKELHYGDDEIFYAYDL